MKKTTTLMIALIAGFASWAQCDATFGSYNSPNTNDVSLYAYDSSQSVTYVWDLGDGTTMTTTTGIVDYTYSAAGNYWACLTVNDGMGCTDTYCDSVVIDSTGTPPPPPATCSADFYWWQPQDSLTGAYSSNVYLVNIATGTNLTYAWDFGDGSTSTQQYPTHTYAQVGSYTICLSVDNGNGCTDTYCDSISVMAKASEFTLNVISESEVASVGIENEEVISFTSMYPNPVNEMATLELNATQNMNVNIVIVDISGKQISNSSLNVIEGNNKVAINTSEFANGYYMLNVSSVDGSFTRTIRFTKQ